MAPLLQQAKDAGIKVATSDTDAPNSVRQVFVEQASTEGIGEGLTDALLEAMGGKGKYAMVSCGQTAENLNSWIDVQKTYTAKKYPDAQIVDTVYAGEDREGHPDGDRPNERPPRPDRARRRVHLIRAGRGAGRPGRREDRQGLHRRAGHAAVMAPYLKDGWSSASILWDVEHLGYLTAWAGVQLADGKSFEAKNDVSKDITGVTYDDKTKVLLLGPPLRITKDNAGDFDY